MVNARSWHEDGPSICRLMQATAGQQGCLMDALSSAGQGLRARTFASHGSAAAPLGSWSAGRPSCSCASRLHRCPVRAYCCAQTSRPGHHTRARAPATPGCLRNVNGMLSFPRSCFILVGRLPAAPMGAHGDETALCNLLVRSRTSSHLSWVLYTSLLDLCPLHIQGSNMSALPCAQTQIP